MNLQAHPVSFPPSNREAERLAALSELRVIDPGTAALLEGFGELASVATQCPVAWISFVDAEHELVVSVHGARARLIDRAGSQAGEIVEGGVPIAIQSPNMPLPIEAEGRIAYF